MFRCSVLLCLFVLLHSTTPSPYKSKWEKENADTVQDTRYHDYDEKTVLEIEPVEEQDLTEFDIDPHMAIWKAMKRFRQQKNNKPEEDKDNPTSDVQHSTGNKQVEAYFDSHNYRPGRLHQEDEKDLDNVYHNVQGPVNHVENKEIVLQPEIPVSDKVEEVELRKTSVYLTPEEDKDGQYHGDFGVQVLQVPVIFPEDHPKIAYSEPEEDQDYLFHC